MPPRRVGALTPYFEPEPSGALGAEPSGAGLVSEPLAGGVAGLVADPSAGGGVLAPEPSVGVTFDEVGEPVQPVKLPMSNRLVPTIVSVNSFFIWLQYLFDG